MVDRVFHSLRRFDGPFFFPRRMHHIINNKPVFSLTKLFTHSWANKQWPVTSQVNQDHCRMWSMILEMIRRRARNEQVTVTSRRCWSDSMLIWFSHRYGRKKCSWTCSSVWSSSACSSAEGCPSGTQKKLCHTQETRSATQQVTRAASNRAILLVGLIIFKEWAMRWDWLL